MAQTIYDVGEIWRQRSFKLRDVLERETPGTDRHMKASRLWLATVHRVLETHRVASLLRNASYPKDIGTPIRR